MLKVPLTMHWLVAWSLLVLLFLASDGNALGAFEECCVATGVPTSKQPRPQNVGFLMGAQKSGTTYLFNELIARHSMIKPWRNRTVLTKEPHYFDQVPLGSFDKYLDGFVTSGNPNSSYTYLDATPDYIHIPAAACRLSVAFPNAKLVAVLKDPAMRSLSAWNMVKHMGKQGIRDYADELYSEMKALRSRGCSYEVNPPQTRLLQGSGDDDDHDAQQELDRDGSSTSAIGSFDLQTRHLSASTSSSIAWRRATGLPSWNQCFRCQFTYCGNYSLPTSSEPAGKCQFDIPRAGILRRGLYVYQLEWWLRFFPPEQLLVLNYDQVNKDPEAVLDQVIRFLGQDPTLKKKKAEKSSIGFHIPHSRNEYDVYAKAIDDAYRFYAHPNEELYRFLASLRHDSLGWTAMAAKFFRTKLQTLQKAAAIVS